MKALLPLSTYEYNSIRVEEYKLRKQFLISKFIKKKLIIKVWLGHFTPSIVTLGITDENFKQVLGVI